MSRYVAFLRGMNLGGRRVKNDELCEIFRDLGFQGVAAFLASGNVIFDTRRSSPAQICREIEVGLQEALGYEVPTFLRTAAEVLAIAEAEPFPGSLLATRGKLQVGLLGVEPAESARAEVLALETDRDRLAIRGRELYWLPEGRMSDSELDLTSIEAALGPMTMRTKRTVDRIAGRFFSD